MLMYISSQTTSLLLLTNIWRCNVEKVKEATKHVEMFEM